MAVKIGGAGQHPALVLEVALGHGDRGGRWRVKGGTRLEKAYDLAAALSCAFHDGVDARLRGPAHLDKVGQRNARHRGITDGGNHVVAVSAQNKRGDALDGDIEFLGEKIAKTRGIEHSRHADHLVGGKARAFLQRPDDDVERVGDADDEGVWSVFLDARADLGDDAQIDGKEVVAAHSGLAWHARGDDDDIRALDQSVIVSACHFGVRAMDRAGLREIKRLAARHPADDIEQGDVAELFHARQMRQRAADLTCADESDFLTRHLSSRALKSE